MTNTWNLLSIGVLIVICVASAVHAQNTGLNLYTPVAGYPCTRLMSKDGVIGCQTSRGGASGALWPLDTQQDIEDWVKNPPSDKKVLLLQNSIFTKDNVAKLQKTGKVAGVLVPSDTTAPLDGFSPADPYPNKRFGIHNDADWIWNPVGNSWDFNSYDFPIWSLSGRMPFPDDSSRVIVNVTNENKRRKGEWPQYAINMEAFMSAGTDSETCLRRGRCDPLGGKSIWSAFGPIDPNKEIILAIAQIDSNAFFHDLAVGADSSMSGAIALLLAAKQLQYAFQKNLLTKQLVFAFFTGEAWGYIGSKRFVKDITSFTCKETVDGTDRCNEPPTPTLAFQNIKLDKISAIIELNQVGQLPPSDTNNRSQIFIHWEKPNQSSNQADLLAALSTVRNKVNSTVDLRYASANTPGIPPSSLMSFVANNPNQAGVVLTGFDRNYTNKYYGSRFDRRISLLSLCRAANVLSQTMYQLGKNASAPQIDFTTQCTFDSLVGILNYCLTIDIGCDSARTYFNAKNKYYETQPTSYTGVFRADSVLSLSALYIYYSLVNIMGTPTSISCTNDKDCGNGFCMNSTCLTSETYWHNALSLAFEPHSDGSISIVKDYWDSESTWTESRWNTPQIRLFQKDNPLTEILSFVFGAIEVVVSFVVVWFMRKYFARRFKT
jgi:nicastrin